MPQSWLAWCVAQVEPNVAVGLLLTYLVRLASGLYVFMGAMLLLFATDVRRYRTAIAVAMWWIALFGVAVLIPGARYIPNVMDQWFFWCVACDGLVGLVTVVAVLVLQARVHYPGDAAIRRRRSRQSSPTLRA
jgi:hypothetical protein